MTDNVKSYINDCIEHDVLFEMFGNQLYELNKADYEDLIAQMSLLLEEADTLSTKSAVNKILSSFDDVISQYKKNLKERLNDNATEIAKKESSFLKDLFLTAFGISLFVPAKTSRLIPLASYSNQNTVDTFADNFSEKIESAYKNAVMTAYVMGTPKNELSETIKQTTDTLEKNLETESRNIATGLQRQTRNYIYLKNEKKISFVWNSILDNSTCLVCGEMHGKRFNSISQVPGLPPLHLNCRCSIIAVPEDTKVEMPSYSEWLEEQSEETQREVLGKTRYNLYKNGMKVDSFVNNGKKLTLDEIYKKNV